VRSNVVSKFPGGVAQLYAVVLKKLFGVSNPHNMASAGMCVTLKGGDGVPVQIFFDMAMNAADEPALKFVLHCKGHAGLKPCMVCTNVCMSDRNLEGENPDGTQIVNSQCIDTTKWVRATDDSARETMEMLRDRKPGVCCGRVGDHVGPSECDKKGKRITRYPDNAVYWLGKDISSHLHSVQYSPSRRTVVWEWIKEVALATADMPHNGNWRRWMRTEYFPHSEERF